MIPLSLLLILIAVTTDPVKAFGTGLGIFIIYFFFNLK